MFRLIYLNGNRKGKRLLIRGGTVAIGSSSKCGIRIEDDRLAPEQAVIDDRGRDIFLRDLSPSGNVKINGDPVENSILHDGDVIDIGPRRLRFQSAQSISAFAKRRKGHHIQRLTFIAVLILVLVEVAIIAGWMVYLERVDKAPSETTTTVAPAKEELVEEAPPVPEPKRDPATEPETNQTEVVLEPEPDKQPPEERDAVQKPPTPEPATVDETEEDLKGKPITRPKTPVDIEDESDKPPARPQLSEQEDTVIPDKPVVETAQDETGPMPKETESVLVPEDREPPIEGRLTIENLKSERVYDSANRLRRVLVDIEISLTEADEVPRNIDGRVEIECIFRDSSTGQLIHSDPQDTAISMKRTQEADYAAKASFRTHDVLSAVDAPRKTRLDYAGFKIRLYAKGELHDEGVMVDRLSFLLDAERGAAENR